MAGKRSMIRIVLGLACGGLLLSAVLSPWWKITIAFGGRSDSITAYPYKLEGARLMDLIIDSGEYLGPTETSTEMKLHTAALIIGALLSFVGGVLNSRQGNAAFAAAGVLVLLDIDKFRNRIQWICETHYHMPMEGKAIVTVGIGPYYITTEFMRGIDLATAAAVLALILALLCTIVVERRRFSRAAG